MSLHLDPSSIPERARASEEKAAKKSVNRRVAWDKFCKCIPLVATVNSIFNMHQKNVYQKMDAEDPKLKDKYHQRIIHEPTWQQVILLVPILGQIVVGIASIVESCTSPKKPKQVTAMAEMGGTYDHTIACCDFAYSKHNILGVFDAAGHNKQHIHDDQVPLFQQFFDNLAIDLTGVHSFSTEEEAFATLNSSFAHAAPDFVTLSHFYSDNPEAKYAAPALFAGFVTTIGEEKRFIGGQLADCCLCHRKQDGTYIFHRPKNDIGLGDHSSPKNRTGRLPDPIAFTVEKGDELYIFSDGIGEFMADGEFQAVIERNSDRAKLLQDFHQAITVDLKADAEHTTRPCIAQKPGRMDNPCKPHDGLDSHKHDDISIAYLRIK